jgi:hypothetical protein
MTSSMRFTVAVATAAFLLGGPGAASTAAQDQGSPAETGTAPSLDAGWTYTPAITYGGSWDDNVLIQGIGDATRSDFVNSINPRADISFGGRRGEFVGAYSGSFMRYRDLNSLNSYDQHVFGSARRQVTKYTTIFGSNTFSASRTTELAALTGVPFIRTGSRVEDLRAGVQTELTKHVTASAAYNFQWIDFAADPASNITLLGGHSHGMALSLRRALGERTVLTADYDLQRATVEGADGFNVHNGSAGADHHVSPSLRVFGSFGVARLGVGSAAPSRTGLAWRAGLSHQLEEASLGVVYSRSFVPSYSFGGTQQNEEVTADVRVPLTRRIYSQSSMAWRRNEALDPGGDNLKSVLLGSSIGYAVRPWIRVEGFFEGSYQSVARPGGRLDRNRVGVKLVTAKSMRIR